MNRHRPGNVKLRQERNWEFQIRIAEIDRETHCRSLTIRPILTLRRIPRILIPDNSRRIVQVSRRGIEFEQFRQHDADVAVMNA